MNTVTVPGWLHADPVTEHVGDLAVCELRLAVERPAPDRRPNDVVTVTCFGRLAVLAAERLAVGRPRRSQRLAAHPARRRASDGSAGQRVDVVAERLDFLGHPIARDPGTRRAPRGRLRRPLRARRGVVMTVRLRPHRRHRRRARLGRSETAADGVARPAAWPATSPATGVTSTPTTGPLNDRALRARTGPGPVRLPAPRRARRHDRRDAGVGDHRRPRGPRHRHHHPLAQRLLTRPAHPHHEAPARPAGASSRATRAGTSAVPTHRVAAARGADRIHIIWDSGVIRDAGVTRLVGERCWRW